MKLNNTELDTDSIKLKIIPLHLLDGITRVVLRDRNDEDLQTLRIENMTEDGVIICKPDTHPESPLSTKLATVIEKLEVVIIVQQLWAKMSPEGQEIMQKMGYSLQDLMRVCLK